MKRFTIDKLNPVLEDFLSSPSYEPQPFSSDFIPPCDYFPNCKDSKVNIGLNNWYDSDYFKERVKGYEIEYPDRELFLADLNKKIYYTIDCINRLIGKQNGENAIIEYIMYIFFSFGSTGTKQNIGWHFYFLYLYRLLPNVKAIRNGDITVQKRVDEINDFLNEHIYGKSGKINEERKQLATKAAEKWVKTFPFELDVIKEYKFSPSYPVFTITQNPYNPQVGSIYYHNESEVLKSLIRQTNELISKIDLYELAKKGIISSDNVKEVEFDFSHKKYTLEINRIANKYETGELEYVETLEKWLAASEKHFEYLKKYLSEPRPNTIQIDTPPIETKLWRCVPVSIAKEHFRVFYTNNSKNEKPFLTETQYNNFIKRAFENDTNIEKQTFNFSSGEKGFVIKRFYEFFDLSMTYGEKSDKQPYIDLVMNNFTNWNKESEVKSFMKPDKSKRNW